MKAISEKELKEITGHFDIRGEAQTVSPLGEGLINDTFLVTTVGDTPDYVLQRINHNVFRDVEGMQRNIEAVTSHIRKKLSSAGERDIDRKVLKNVEVKDTGKTYHFDGRNYWRISLFIPDTVTLQEVTPVTARHAGRAFGRFQKMLADMETTLTESIPDFHNMEFRLTQLDEAVSTDAVGRTAEVKDLLEEIDKRRTIMCEPERMYREGRIPKRICHCDTKVNNMLFDRNGDVLCVIDLDTVMPSFVFSDFGDFLRTGACTAPEDEPDISRIDFDMAIFNAFAEGYLSEAASFLTQAELDWLADSVALFPYMQAVRFLTDYINGDTYYKTRYPEHNLVRTRAQLALLKRIESRLPEIKDSINQILFS
ncbi:MAG: aminoglycoside phosphotransferase family protein [Muribaculaceae bacterium]|nr:aminoglycoside phosphotransferase family protein [Muribaculaceae bacterium]